MKRSIFLSLSVLLLAAVGLAASSPYLPGAAWPGMRGGLSGNGVGPLGGAPASTNTDNVVRFHTGSGIFSTPVIDDQDRIYVGSADHFFYAFDPATQQELWRYETGEIIDSAAALGPDGIYVPSGDAKIHALSYDGKPLWQFDNLNDRPAERFSASTNYWWEGNVVIGPDGNLYAGSDDFAMYSLTPEGKVRWFHRTGFFIWGAASFLPDGTVLVPSFDMKLYALELDTGKRRWKTDLKNALVSTPAVAPGGTIYQGSMDGNLHALTAKGKLAWSFKTGGHVYASAAVAPDGLVYVTSADGSLYALSPQGKEKWSFYTGDAVRSSPVVGPDPEGQAAYLVYFGGGDGSVYAIDPAGRRRWSYDTLTGAGEVDYPNINASPALGKRGLAVATAGGAVIWIPYNYYLREGAAGINRDPGDGFAADGVSWYWVSPGGRIDKTPLAADDPPRVIQPGQTLNLRFLLRQGGRVVRAKLDPKTLNPMVMPEAKSTGFFRVRVELQDDGRTLLVIPEELMNAGDYRIIIRADYAGPASGHAELILVVRSPGKTDGAISPAPGSGYRVVHMAVPEPAIIPSLDQIGIMSLNLPWVVLDASEADGRFFAYGLQRFGENEDGVPVGVPNDRVLYYAFNGWMRDGAFMLRSGSCLFEATGFPMPLDRVSFTGRLLPGGEVERGSSMMVELKPKGMKQALDAIMTSSNAEYSARLSKAVGTPAFNSAFLATVPTVVGYLNNKVWSEWGMYNSDHRFIGAGTFRMKALPEAELARPAGVTLKSFTCDLKKGVVVGSATVAPRSGRKVVLGILVVAEKTGVPDVNLNLALTRTTEGEAQTVTFTAPKGYKLEPGMRAYLMADLHPLAVMDLR